MTHRDFLASLPTETRRALQDRKDGPALRHLAGHLGVILVLAVIVALGLPGWPLALPILGVAMAFLFTLQHECTHRTPFATPWVNEVVGHGAGLILGQPFLWFRAFHMAHHRFTNDPERDPELSEGKPEGWRALAWHLGTLGYWRAKAVVLWKNAFGRIDGAYVPEGQRKGLRLEARVMLAVYAGVVVFTLTVSPILIWVWLLPLVLGFPVLRLYLLAEHGRCPAVADMFDNTRTTLTNRLVRALAWNMPFHAEHHAWPVVPFHKLPEMHRLAAPHLKRVSAGYSGFTADYVKAF